MKIWHRFRAFWAWADKLGKLTWAVLAALIAVLWATIFGEANPITLAADTLKLIGAYSILHPLRAACSVVALAVIYLTHHWGRKIISLYRAYLNLSRESEQRIAEINSLKETIDTLQEQVEDTAEENKDARALLSASGLFAFRPHETSLAQTANWELFQKRAEQAANKNLWIMGATGWKTFGLRTSPLHDILLKFNGHVRIMLIDPRGDNMQRRVAMLKGSSTKSYKAQITNSVKFCEELSSMGKDIELRFYDDIPSWKLLITSDTLWMQHYPDGDHVDNTPVYLFYSTEEEKGIYDFFRVEFFRMWENSRQHIMGASIKAKNSA